MRDPVVSDNTKVRSMTAAGWTVLVYFDVDLAGTGSVESAEEIAGVWRRLRRADWSSQAAI
jgi:hypothetical protein